MASTVTSDAETNLRTATQERNSETADIRDDSLVQGSAEWEQRLRSLGQRSRSVPLSPDATSREAIYEDAAL